MTRYVALLRGVNVNGITIRSAELKALFETMGFGGVKTVLASGNVVFDADADHGLKGAIEAGLRERFGYDAWIVLRRQDELAAIVDACPFPPDSATEHAYVVFGSDPTVLDELAATPEAGGEGVIRGDGVLYWQVARGSTLDTSFSKVIAKTRFKPHVTTRNVRTVMKLA
jgi:uncharacterized protein (DUF1697 family)